MTTLQIYQKSIIELLQQLLSSHGALKQILDSIAKLKEEAVKNLVIGKIFQVEDLLERNNYRYDTYKGYKYKAVCVHCYSNDIIIYDSLQDKRLITLEIHFLRDPEQILENKKQLTDKERTLLKQLQKFYDVDRCRCSKEQILSADRELCGLKHGYSLLFNLCWSFSLESITKDNFLEAGLKAVKSITQTL